MNPSHRLPPVIRWGMVVVLLLAALLRLGALPDLPRGLHYDEAANLILTRQIAEDGYRPLFIRAYTGKEVLFFYAAAPWVQMTGGAPWGLRLGSAMLGTLTVAASFAAVRALFRGGRPGDTIALFAAGWLAFAFPHVLLSRYGFRAIAQPLLQALTVATLWRGLRTGRTRWLLPAGTCLGLTAYTYLAARLFPVPLAVALGVLLVRAPSARRHALVYRYALVLAAALVTFAPLGLFFLQNPGTFLTRIDQVAAPSLDEALTGIWRCLRALVWPGAGDGYVRFNASGLPLLRPVAALLATVGLGALMVSRRRDPLTDAGRWLVALAIGVMILPSALATGEITPSNLRMVGLFPFLAVIPALGLEVLLRRLPGGQLPWLIASAALVGGTALTGVQYLDWAQSRELFRASDGAMVLAAEVLDGRAGPGTTVAIASEHYRHPTVAALAQRYADAKWLTGGATVVLPPVGDAVIVVPPGLDPPAPWPDAVTGRWVTNGYGDADLGVTLDVHALSADAIRAARAELIGGASGAPADFGHIVLVHDARPAAACRVAAPCPILVLWEPRAASPPLQPVVRLWHPATGEWARAMAFHYPSEQWTPGDIVIDHLVVTPPVGMPPGGDYRIGVGFYDPDRDEALPRLADERFAGLEAAFPDTNGGITVAPVASVSAVDLLVAACPGIPRDDPVQVGDLALLGRRIWSEGVLLPGSKISVRLCWRANAKPPTPDARVVEMVLTDGIRHQLYRGDPAGGYPFARWRAGEVVEDRYTLTLPRELRSGPATLTVRIEGATDTVGGTPGGHVVELARVDIQPIDREFVPPPLANQADAVFSSPKGGAIRLIGYEVAQAEADLTVTLAWQLLNEMNEDYTLFLHLRDAATGELVAQVDEMPHRTIGCVRTAYATSLWMQGEVVVDSHTLTLPVDRSIDAAMSASPALSLGFYLPESGVYLTVGGARELELGAPTP